MDGGESQWRLGGSVAVVAIALFWRGHRTLAIPFAMPVTFSIWGLAAHGQRALELDGPDTEVERALLRAVRVVMVALGGVAAVATVFAITFAFAGSGGMQLR
jgi:hypothetical protein